MASAHNEVDAPWNPLPVDEVVELLRGADFFWCLAGGRAIERVVGRPYRAHKDIDVVVLRPQQLAVQSWLEDWRLAIADPPGTLRPWIRGERMPWRVHDVWGHRADSTFWQLQVMIQEAEGDTWFFRRDDRVHGRLDDLATVIGNVPCLRMDLQLLFKAKTARPKDELDFVHVLPHLSAEQRRTLVEWMRITCANGHHWIAVLEQEAGHGETETGGALRE